MLLANLYYYCIVYYIYTGKGDQMLERLTRDLELDLQDTPTHEGLLYVQDVLLEPMCRRRWERYQRTIVRTTIVSGMGE